MEKPFCSLKGGSVLILPFLASSPVFASHKMVSISCDENTHPAVFTIHSVAGGSWDSFVWANSTFIEDMAGSNTAGSTFTVTIVNPLFLPGVNVYTTTSQYGDASTVCGPTLNFTDGRCNQEPYQSVAVYPDDKGGYNFYALYNGVGYFAMHVTEQNLDDNADTGVTHKIAEAKGVQLFRLAGGGLQVNRMGKDNKMYSYNIGSCGAMED